MPIRLRKLHKCGRIMKKRFIPTAEPYMTKADVRAVVKALENRRLSQGENVERFEKEFAKYTGTKEAVVFNSGTAAIQACLYAIGVGPGDEVITSPFTMAATTNPVVLLGARPVFVDIELDTFNIDPEKIEKAITQRTKVIVPVHYAGQCADMDEIMKIAEKHDIFVLEDACEAHGAFYRGKKAGSIGDAGAFSFYPNKNIATGEGGMLTTNNEELAHKCRVLRAHGQDGRYHHVEIGWNFKMPDFVAALGRVQLKHLDYIITKKNQIADYYTPRLKEIEDVHPPVTKLHNKHTYMLYAIRTKTHKQREKLSKTLEKNGIETRLSFPSVHLQPVYVKRYGFKRGDLPVSEHASDTVICLPIFVGLKQREQDYILSLIEKTMQR